MKTVKCLSQQHMNYIQANYEMMTAQKMAENLQVEHYKVTLFCQANRYEPFQDRITILRKNKDSFHVIPAAKKQKMSTAKYNKPINAK